MRKVSMIALLLLLCGAYAFAGGPFPSSSSDAPKGELAGGWNYLRVDSDAVPSQNGFPGGFFVDGTYYFANFLGLTGDFQYNKKTFSTDAHFTSGDAIRVISFHGGPRVKVRAGALEPFAHALFGFTNANLNPAGSLPGISSESATKFSMKLGGGVDVKVAPHFAVRLAEVNYYRTTFSSSDFPNIDAAASSVGGSAFGTKTSQNNFTFGVGVVIR